MKKIFVTIITTGLVLSLTGCEKKTDNIEKNNIVSQPQVVNSVSAVTTENIEMIKIDSVEQFDKVLKQHPKVVADFYADWCPPCKKLTPILEKLANKYIGDVQFIKINVDNNPELSKRFKVSSIPLVVYFKDGEVFQTEVGLSSEDKIIKIIDSIK
ncbi:MAG: thioredoxin [Candidatus Muirbacterium halophilum]|nr:thioredoxin [Candidatus Muirbacterium halophilum]MCK9474656.1 thioredoxin [Candidatus Muirbacterium halophilum]